MAVLRIHRDIIELHKELVLEILQSFESTIDVTTVEDRANGWYAYLVRDKRIALECRNLEVVVFDGQQDTSMYSPDRLLFENFKGRYSAYFDDGLTNQDHTNDN